MNSQNSTAFDLRGFTQSVRDQGPSWISQIEYFDSLASSNDYLTGLDAPIHGRLCIVDYQTQGKGRQGKRWQATRGGSLMFSLGWAPSIRPGPELSLVVGLAIADMLDAAGVPEVGLKWPNDVLIGEAKVAGILLESRFSRDVFELVIGVGMNIAIDSAGMHEVASRWSDLSRAGVTPHPREHWLHVLLLQLDKRFRQLQQSGFSAIREDWLSYHVHQGVNMRYQYQGDSRTGRVVGLDEAGALLIESKGEIRAVMSGEVNTLRAAP